MQKSVGKETMWGRVKLLVRGLLLYNTIYWRRASDGLKPPKLTPAERKALAPPLNPDVIKPRANPRARLLRRRESLAQARESMAPTGTPEFIIGAPSEPDPPRAPEPLPSMRRRRRKKYRRNLAKSLSPSGSSSSFFSRLIGK